MNSIRRILGACLLGIIMPGLAIAQQSLSAQLKKKQVRLPNGWSLSPAGRSLPLGDLPLNMSVAPNKRWMAVTNNGQSVQSLQLVDLQTNKIASSVVIPRSWYGLKFGADSKTLYASAGNNNQVLIYTVQQAGLVLKDSIVLGKKWPEKISPAGLEVEESSDRLYVVTKENNSLYTISLKDRKVIDTKPIGAEAYACLLSPDKKRLFISVWGGDKVLVLNTANGMFTDSVKVGDNPNELLLNKSGSLLYVANASDNSVSVIRTRDMKEIEVLNAALFPNSPPGSSTNGLALTRDESALYVSNADNNCLAVFDVRTPLHSISKGYIPVGWYPTSVKIVNNTVYVANGKGFTSMANPYGPNPVAKRQAVKYQSDDTSRPREVQYIGGLFKGTLSFFQVPDAASMSVYSRQVYANTPYNKSRELESKGEAGNPIPMKVGAPSPIKHVFYIVKENRTYDQVLGDMPEGNGDTSLVLFGEKVTPNQHALAREFVLLDNFYVDGEVSADGHNWTLGAHANDYLEKTWPTSYGGRGGIYDAEGNREIANNKGGFIWDHCKRAGVSYRTYGEFADDYKANIPVLEGHFCPYYTSWDETVRDTSRFYQWKRDFDSLLAINQVPQFNSLRLINDHTEGLSKGKPTPFAHVADNDLAVGMFVEYLSKSPIWKESVVFIVEDDAQNGPDHVDAHRSPAYIAGGYVKRGFVDHTMYSTSSVLRTIELILGIPPMTQYDAAAMPMFRAFSPELHMEPFLAKAPQTDLTERNVAVNELSERSDKFDLTKEDRVPDLEFNEVLWYGIKGMHVPFPGPRRAAFFVNRGEENEEED